MSRIYIDAELAVGAEIALDKPRAHYLKNVLRLKPGAAFFLFNGRESVDYRASLLTDGKNLGARVDSAYPLATESSLHSHVLQGLGRADHMDWMIQKTTELGVTHISLFTAARSQGSMKPAQIEKKLGHWRGVAISACEQCGRAILPRIEYLPALGSALASSAFELALLLDVDGADFTAALPPRAGEASVLLGPEGGLDESEIDLARNHGFRPVHLGPRVLRTETAAAAALALLQSALGDL